jgi:hypothetical protein
LLLLALFARWLRFAVQNNGSRAAREAPLRPCVPRADLWRVLLWLCWEEQVTRVNVDWGVVIIAGRYDQSRQTNQKVIEVRSLRSKVNRQ